MTVDWDCCHRGAAHFAAKEPALAEILRGKEAWSDATLDELVEIAASVHCLRGMCLKTLAAAEEDDIVCVVAAEYLAHVATCTPHVGDSIPKFPYEAVADQVFAAVAAGARDPGVVGFVEGCAERARRLRRGAADFGGEDAVKLREHAATVEDLCADTEAFPQKMVSSPYWRMWRNVIGREAGAQAHTPMKSTAISMDTTPADTTPLLSTSERSDQREW
jgi:hypothetical protein